MGTQYRVTADCPVDVGADITRELVRLNQEMSTYDESSTVSRFNRATPGRWFAVGTDLVTVVAAAAQLSVDSAGAFDITVGPLVNLWGFGPGGFSAEQPAPEQIDAALARIGHGYLEFRVQPSALLKHQDLYVDLSAIAKGYGVDRLAELLIESACGDFIVEIGGEVRTRGTNERGAMWRVGVEVPDPESSGAVQRVLHLGEHSLATSGDYRNFFAQDGTRFSHTIDPRTGRPVNHQLASVTVAHDSAMWADGYATLLNVLGPQAGYAFAQESGLAALFIVRTEHGFEERYTEPMQAFLRSR
jgi:thiamine biosynthesis lipoprotein